MGNRPSDLVIDPDHSSVWVTNGEDGTVTRLDADGRAQGEPIRVGRDRGDNTVSRIDAAGGEVIGDPIGVGRAPTGLAAGDGAIWVANTADGTVLRLDPETGARIGDPLPAGKEPVAVTMDEYSAWVADATGAVAQFALQPG